MKVERKLKVKDGGTPLRYNRLEGIGIKVPRGTEDEALRRLNPMFDQVRFTHDDEWAYIDARASEPNLYVTTGLRNSLLRETGIGGNAWARGVVTDDNTAVTAATTKFDPTDDDTVIFKAFNASFPELPASPSTTAAVEYTIEKSDGNIPIYKVGISSGTTDESPNMVNAIGGGLTNPIVDLTPAMFTDWSVTPRIEVEAKVPA
jgi:hypothetical protein